jgi:hypothetical protein
VLWILAFALGDPWALSWSGAALVAEFAVWLSTTSGIASYAPLFGAGLLAAMEAAQLALELPKDGILDRRALGIRAASVGTTTLLGAALGAAVLAVAGISLAITLPFTLAGTGAIAGTIGLVRRLAAKS